MPRPWGKIVAETDGLGKIVTEPDRVIEALVEALKPDNADLRAAAARSLARFGPPPKPPLRRAAKAWPTRT